MAYNNWKELCNSKETMEEKVCHLFPDSYEKCIFCWSDSYYLRHKFPMKEKYGVCLFPEKDVFIVWDCKRHIACGTSRQKEKCLSVGLEWEDIEKRSYTFSHYKKIGNRGDAPYEKVYIVRINDWRVFFAHIEEFMSFNEFDIDYPSSLTGKNIIQIDGETIYAEEDRKRYSSQKLQRKSEFRAQVLLAYSNECAICQCDIPELLQAAHLHGHEVADTDLSEDRAENGICLCANHHLMYDSDLIDLDLEQAKVIVRDKRANALLPSSKIKRPHSAAE